jgi:pimeloyl-ACP methyl ester carboxylesterase
VLTHGWPGSIVEFHKVIEPLTNPTAHGGRAQDAFHVVCPSLPGYGFSAKPATTGWGVQKIAETWDVPEGTPVWLWVCGKGTMNGAKVVGGP